MKKSSYDLVIVGAGLTGLALALALRESKASILLLDAKAEREPIKQNSEDIRAIALSYGSQQIFKKWYVWSGFSSCSAPILQVHISDKGHFGISRIQAQDYEVEALGYVVPINELVSHLQNEVKHIQSPNFTILRPAEVIHYQREQNKSLLTLKTETGTEQIEAKLILAADGQMSKLAELLAIKKHEKDYQQSAVIANIGLNQSHGHVAYERFTSVGAVAMLPAQGDVCTTVLTLPEQEAQKWSAYSDLEFIAELQELFGYRLGRFQWVGKRQSYPLKLTLLKENIKEQVIFLGNASHTLHPIAAQGFNLGLRDVELIAKLLKKSSIDQSSFDSKPLCDTYNQGRYWDQRLQTAFTHSLTQIFGHEKPFITFARNTGLMLFDRLPFIKGFIAKKLMGLA